VYLGRVVLGVRVTLLLCALALVVCLPLTFYCPPFPVALALVVVTPSLSMERVQAMVGNFWNVYGTLLETIQGVVLSAPHQLGDSPPYSSLLKSGGVVAATVIGDTLVAYESAIFHRMHAKWQTGFKATHGGLLHSAEVNTAFKVGVSVCCGFCPLSASAMCGLLAVDACVCFDSVSGSWLMCGLRATLMDGMGVVAIPGQNLLVGG
jgi:hypothetical protein